jgi:hypothetical protein
MNDGFGSNVFIKGEMLYRCRAGGGVMTAVRRSAAGNGLQHLSVSNVRWCLHP